MDEFRISKGIARWIADFTPPVNPYYSPALIHLHFEGANNSTTFTDVGTRGQAWTPYRGASISTAHAEGGTGSGVFYNSSQDGYITTPDSDFWATMWTTGFKVDFWIYPTAVEDVIPFCQLDPGHWIIGVVVHMTAAGGFPGVGGHQVYFVYPDPGGVYYAKIVDVELTQNAWNHVICQRVGNQISFVVNDVDLGSQTITTDMMNINGGLYVGGHAENNGTAVRGYLDEVKVYGAG
jgi:hypothetical protein